MAGIPLITIDYKYIINFIFKPARRNLYADKGEGYDSTHFTD
jgi:hypothetical protein